MLLPVCILLAHCVCRAAVGFGCAGFEKRRFFGRGTDLWNVFEYESEPMCPGPPKKIKTIPSGSSFWFLLLVPPSGSSFWFFLLVSSFWFLLLVVPSACSFWFFLLVLPSGSFFWFFLLVLPSGSSCWCFLLVLPSVAFLRWLSFWFPLEPFQRGYRSPQKKKELSSQVIVQICAKNPVRRT